MNLKNRTFVETKCLFCDKGEDLLLYPARLQEDSFTGYTFSARRNRRREHYQMVTCQRCGLVRSNPILDENKISALYSESYFIFSEEAPYAARTYAKLLAELINRYIPGGITSLLEIGCSTGFFLEEALRLGIREVTGFEPSKDCKAKAREPVKSHIIDSPFDPCMLNGKTFDLACGFHVLDHLPKPMETLAAVKQCTRPNGYILLVCHDVKSWSAKLLREYSPIFDVEHIFLFSQKTIRHLFERAGYQVLEIGPLANRYPLSYWMRILPLAQWAVYGLPRFLRNIPITLKGGNLYVFGKLS